MNTMMYLLETHARASQARRVRCLLYAFQELFDLLAFEPPREPRQARHAVVACVRAGAQMRNLLELRTAGCAALIVNAETWDEPEG